MVIFGVPFFSFCTKEETTKPSRFIEPVPEDGTWRYIRPENSGLPSNAISAIVFDRQGHLWIGTSGDGLAYFNGNNWQVLVRASSGLPSNLITALKMDYADALWIGTENGLVKFTGSRWQIFSPQNSPLPGAHVTALGLEITGRLWVGTTRGLACLEADQWYSFNSHDSELSYCSVSALLIDSNGRIWIGTDAAGLIQYDGTRVIVHNSAHADLLKYRINVLALDRSGLLWVGTDGGLASYNGNKWLIYPIDGRCLDGAIQALAVDHQNVKWIGTRYDPTLTAHQGGLVRFDGKDWTLFKKANSGLSDNDVRVLLCDTQFCLWIGTHYGGISIFCPNASAARLPSSEKRTMNES